MFELPVLQARNPIVRWSYFVDEWDQIQEALQQHIELTVISMVLGFAVAAVMAAVALRYSWTLPPITATALSISHWRLPVGRVNAAAPPRRAHSTGMLTRKAAATRFFKVVYVAVVVTSDHARTP